MSGSEFEWMHYGLAIMWVSPVPFLVLLGLMLFRYRLNCWRYHDSKAER